MHKYSAGLEIFTAHIEIRIQYLVQVLVNAGADREKVDHNQKTPLDRAVERGHCEVAYTLVESGLLRGATYDKLRGNPLGQTLLAKVSLCPYALCALIWRAGPLVKYSHSWLSEDSFISIRCVS